MKKRSSLNKKNLIIYKKLLKKTLYFNSESVQVQPPADFSFSNVAKVVQLGFCVCDSSLRFLALRLAKNEIVNGSSCHVFWLHQRFLIFLCSWYGRWFDAQVKFANKLQISGIAGSALGWGRPGRRIGSA
jgi:hypothetical protein